MNIKDQKTFTYFLEGYSVTFSKDLDQLWMQHDVDGSGWLDKSEAKLFIEKLVECIDDRERAALYDPQNFEIIFNQFDEDKNGFLEKSEMSVLIKKVFSKNTPRSFKEEKKVPESLTLSDTNPEDKTPSSPKKKKKKGKK